MVGGKQNDFSPTKPVFCASEISWRSCDCHRVEVNLATLSFGDVTRFNIVVSVYTFQKSYFKIYLFCFVI